MFRGEEGKIYGVKGSLLKKNTILKVRLKTGKLGPAGVYHSLTVGQVFWASPWLELALGPCSRVLSPQRPAQAAKSQPEARLPGVLASVWAARGVPLRLFSCESNPRAA